MTALRQGVDINKTTYVSKPLKFVDKKTGVADRRQHRRPPLPRPHVDLRGARRLGQHRLPAARPRPRPRGRAPDRLRHGHHEPPRRLPGRGPRRPDARRLAARDDARLRDGQRRRLARQADRDHEGRVPRRQGRHVARQAAAAIKVFTDGQTHEADQGDGGQRRSAAPAPRRSSAARRPARPARRTTSSTPGSTASRRR